MPLDATLPRDMETSSVGACPSCGSEDVAAPDTEVSESLAYIRAHVRVRHIERPKVRCRSCQALSTAPMPSVAVPQGQLDHTMLAHLAYSKCGLHLPLKRIAEDLANQGVTLPSSTMSDAMGHTADLLEPVYDALLARLFASPLLLNRLYDEGRILECGRWFHARDKFVEARPNAPFAAEEGIAWIGALFEVERSADEATDCRYDPSLKDLDHAHPDHAASVPFRGCSASVDGRRPGGGLATATSVLNARHGTPIHVVGVPFEGPDAQVVGGAILRVHSSFTFQYPGDATPLVAVQAAVNAWNALGAPGGYTVTQIGASIYVEPTTLRDAAGIVSPYTSPLDLTLIMPRATGPVDEVFDEALAALSVALCTPVHDTRAGWILADGGDGVPVVSLNSTTLTAREVFEQIQIALGHGTTSLYWIGGTPLEPQPAWYYSLLISNPGDENELNATPLLRVLPEPIPLPPG
ncbi:MAG: transposase [Myxococcota bacterium]